MQQPGGLCKRTPGGHRLSNTALAQHAWRRQLAPAPCSPTLAARPLWVVAIGYLCLYVCSPDPPRRERRRLIYRLREQGFAPAPPMGSS